jgi:hypothetical protein
MMLERQRQWLDLVHLALQTDSTRVMSPPPSASEALLSERNRAHTATVHRRRRFFQRGWRLYLPKAMT